MDVNMTTITFVVLWISTGIIASSILVWMDESNDDITLRDFFVLSAFAIVGGMIFLSIVFCFFIAEKGKNIVIYRKRR
jgi:hypothetical protein